MTLAYLVGAIGSVFYGSADFCGGIGARRASFWVVTFFSSVGGLLILLIGLPFFWGAARVPDLAWGAAAGACGALGAALIYRALAIGPVSVASPVLAVTGLVVPVLVGVALGERPSAAASAGLVLAPISIALVTRAPSEVGTATAGSAATSSSGANRSAVRRGLVAGLMAGSVVGFFLVFVSRIGQGAGLLPLVVARGVAIALYAAAFTIARRAFLPPRGARAVSFTAGALDSLANVAFLWAVQRGSLSLVSALVSLAPATTVLLARAVLAERWSVTQVVGLSAALASGALISAG